MDPSHGHPSDQSFIARKDASWNPAFRPNTNADVRPASDQETVAGPRYAKFSTQASRAPFATAAESEHGEWLPSWDNSTPSASALPPQGAFEHQERGTRNTEFLQDVNASPAASESEFNDKLGAEVGNSQSGNTEETASDSEHRQSREDASAEDFNLYTNELESLRQPRVEDLFSQPAPNDPDAPLLHSSVDYEHQSTHTLMEDAVDENPAQSLLARPEEYTASNMVTVPLVEWDAAVGASVDGGYSSVMDPDIVQDIHTIESNTQHIIQHEETQSGIDLDENSEDFHCSQRNENVEADLSRRSSVGALTGGAVFTGDTRPPFEVALQGSGNLSVEESDISPFIDRSKPNDSSGLTDENFPDPQPSVSAGVTKSTEKDDDLAALWSAALGDEEFLEDANAVDPSDFFIDEEEGFLESEADVLSAPTASLQDPRNEREDLQGSAARDSTRQSAQDRYSPGPLTMQDQIHPNQYAPPGLRFIQQSQDTRTFTSSYLPNQHAPYLAPAPSLQQPKRPVLPSKTESFADKAKGGYASPYDLPMEISKHRDRRRVGTQPFASGIGRSRQLTAPTAPPRSSSMPSKDMSGPSQSHAAPANLSIASPSPPPSIRPVRSPPAATPATGAGITLPPRLEKQDANTFFAELPTINKPKTPAWGVRHTPQTNGPMSSAPPLATPLLQRQPSSFLSQHPSTQLQPPERLSLFPGQTPQSNNTPPSLTPAQGPLQPHVPVAAARYSPAPSTTTSIAGARYSPAVPPQPPASTSNLRYAAATAIVPPPPRPQTFAPRTSSPLAHRASTQEQTSAAFVVQDSTSYMSGDQGGRIGSEAAGSVTRGTGQIDMKAAYPPNASLRTPPSSIGALSVAPSAHRTMSSYAPHRQDEAPSPEQRFEPPRRPQTQSPSSLKKIPPLDIGAIERPASVHGPTSPIFGSMPQESVPRRTHRSTASQTLDFIEPADERATDPLQRWKGQPIFTWSVGATTMTSFPKQIPRYTMGQTRPMIKCSPGEIRIRSIREILPLEEHYAQFPGPLRSKGKKKDVIGWLASRIEELDSAIERIPMSMQLQAQEKSLLWKLMRILVEHDGVLEGNASVDKAVCQLLSLDVTNLSDVPTNGLTNGIPLNSVYASSSGLQAESADPHAIDELRRLLLLGHREQAVWHAADNRLWAHAMLISSTLGSETWKKLIHEFVRQEVKKIGNNSQPLAALYEIFAGNGEESIDHLVPPSARAGHQMVSAAGSMDSSGNVLAGLERWRETLGLIISNRSAGDTQALIAMGKLLASYRRIEAAHVCFLFARGSAHFGSVDDPQANFTLVGADLLDQSSNSALSMDSILLSEIYEFALSLSTPATVVPHLQAYKLQYALKLAEHGYRNEAQQYCEAISAAIKSTTKLSPYYNSSLMAALDDLTKRLSQSPKDTSTSWFSRPSAGKVSGILGARFNKFVAGDDSDDGSVSSAKGGDDAAGPFARIATDTPSISRSASTADLYSSNFQSNLPLSSSSNSGYAPASGYALHSLQQQHKQQAVSVRSRYDPQAPSTHQLSRPSLESTRSVPVASRVSENFRGASRGPQRQYSSYGHVSRPNSYQTSIAEEAYPYLSPPQHSQQISGQGSHDEASAGLDSNDRPTSDFSPETHDQATPSTNQEGGSVSSYDLAQSNGLHEAMQDEEVAWRTQSHSESFDPTPLGEQPLTPSHEPPSPSYLASRGGYEPPASNDQPTSDGGYQPPQGGYEPPSYEPYQPETPVDDEDPPVQERKKRSFLDDDEDDTLAKKAAELKRQERAAQDKAADEAFRKAAEADASRDNAATANKKGWLGGWFGGKKEPNAAAGPIKAKLGEENSFYYDAELKKWVNKKGGSAAEATTAPPPPPKAGPPRSATNSVMGSRPPAATDIAPQPTLFPLGSTSPTALRPLSTGPPSGVPSRTVTPAVNEHGSAASGDDAAVASMATQTRGATPPAALAPPSAPPSRPSTSLSNASDIDDLLGAAQPRKGGTLKRGKKGRGYVDVMAK